MNIKRKETIIEFLSDVLSIIIVIAFVLFVFLSLGIGIIFLGSFVKDDDYNYFSDYEDEILMKKWKKNEEIK